MKYVALLLLGLLVACGSSNSTPMVAVPDTKEAATNLNIVNCGFWCDRPDFATILKRHPYYDKDVKERALPELQLMNGLPSASGQASYRGDIILDGPLYENPPPLPDPNTRLYTDPDADDYRNAHIRLSVDFGRQESYEMTGEVFAVVVDDNDKKSTDLILSHKGFLTPDGIFNTFEDKNDQTGIEGAFFGEIDSRENHGIVGIVGTDYFKGTFITDDIVR